MNQAPIKTKVINGTTYHDSTPNELCNVLETLRNNKVRVIITFGDPENKRQWDCTPYRGTIGRSTGITKIPLLVKTSRSLGGDAIFDNCILKIQEVKSKKVLYQV